MSHNKNGIYWLNIILQQYIMLWSDKHVHIQAKIKAIFAQYIKIVSS